MKAICSISLFLLITGSLYANIPPDTGRNTTYVYKQETIQQPASYPAYFRRTSFNFVKIEYRMGFTKTTTSNLPDAWTATGKPSFGGGIGIVLNAGRMGMFSAGLNYQTAGVRLKENASSPNDRDNYIRLQYLKMPLQYQFYVDKNKKVFFGGGGFGAVMLVPAVQKFQVFDEDNMRKFDAGFIASAGAWLSSRWMVQANAEWGMVDIDQASGANLGKNNQYLLTISYVIPFGRR